MTVRVCIHAFSERASELRLIKALLTVDLGDHFEHCSSSKELILNDSDILEGITVS